MPALTGVRVLDLTQFEAGPLCTQTLAWLGAEVVKIESPRGGDRARGVMRTDAAEDGAYFLTLNANKRSVTLDLRQEEGKDLLRRLIAVADVFIENFAPGTIDRLGFGYDAVRALNPRIVFATIKGFPAGTPFESYLAHDQIGQAFAGMMSMTGAAGAPPVRPGPTVGDAGTGSNVALGIVAALYERERTGQGQLIEGSLVETIIGLGRSTFSLNRTGAPAARNGNRSLFGYSVPSDVYPCKGGGPNDWCFIFVNSAIPAQWTALTAEMGRPDLTDDPRFATIPERLKHMAELDETLSAWTRTLPKAEVMERLQAVGVPAGAVRDTMELEGDESLASAGVFAETEHPQHGRVRLPGPSVRMSGGSVPPAPAPLLGADTDGVLSELLGLDTETLAGLRQKGVL